MHKTWGSSAAILLAALTCIGTGCSNSSTAPPPTGSLQITVTGSPGGVGAITVTGPSGYAQGVTVSTTLSALVPGTYTIAALNVFASNATYGPALASQPIPVTASNTPATATVTYAVLPSGWATRAGMPTARFGLAAGVVNGVLYAVGGNDGSTNLATVDAYDPATNTWTTKAAMPTARSLLAAGVVNGILYAVGGLSGLNGGTEFTTAEAYTP
jgi:Kelch motif